ncbi:MAG: hypothetical protein LBK25_07395 [Treponema sp.]|nr:hypothetical protein [Treponema sp.]
MNINSSLKYSSILDDMEKSKNRFFALGIDDDFDDDEDFDDEDFDDEDDFDGFDIDDDSSSYDDFDDE